jgi:hypothetical protein
MFRIALANIRFPATPEESVTLVEQAIAQAAIDRVALICFPECFVPGYRGMGKNVPPPDAAFLERARSAVAAAAKKATIAVVLGTERVVDGALLATALVINADGTVAGFQDKVQLDPSEDDIYSSGSGRRVFQTGPLIFGIAMRVGAIRKRSAGPSGTAHILCSILISTKPSPAVTGLPASPIPRTRSMKKQPCVARPKIPAISRL